MWDEVVVGGVVVVGECRQRRRRRSSAAAEAAVSGRCESWPQRRQQAIGVASDGEDETAAVLAVVRCAASAIGTAEPRATGASKGPPSARHQDRLGSRHKGMDPGEVYGVEGGSARASKATSLCGRQTLMVGPKGKEVE
jgi:hypothetical protein